jgi:hypothetical protein
MAADPAKIVRRLDALKSARTVHESVWRSCFDFTFPLRGSGFQSTDLDASSGQSKQSQLLDGTGTDSGRILASAIMAGATPANSVWFEQEVDDETEEEERWFDENTPTLWKNIHSSNFDSEGFECCLDLVAAGWFAMYVDQDRDTHAFAFDAWPLSQVYIASTKAGGRADIVYRAYKLTAEQAVEEFGDALSDQTRKLATDRPDELVDFAHAIYPRVDGRADAIYAKHLPIASCKVEVKAKKLLSESGYHEHPVIVPRWQRLPQSCYGVGPAYDALPDMRMLNTLSFDEMAMADIAVAGMWIAKDDGVLNPRTIKVGPRKIIVAAETDSMAPLTPGSDWKLAEYLVNAKQAAIRKIFMADQLKPQDAPGDTTAYEVHVRVNLIRQLLGPVYGRLQPEYLQPLVERCFGLGFRSGMFTPAPASLRNRPFHVKYVNPLARAQRAEQVTAMDQMETVLIQQASVKPEVLDIYKFEEADRERSELLGVPMSLIRTDDELQELRDTRAKVAQAAQAAAPIQAGAQKFAETAGERLAQG